MEDKRSISFDGSDVPSDDRRDRAFMELAIGEARRSAEAGDVPVGAVLVCPAKDGYELVSVGHNTREQEQDALGHAEINAIRDACKKLGSWRLSDCILYVTLEPCPMCTGAILAARIGRVVYATPDPVAGAMGSVWSLHSHPVADKSILVEHGCCEGECRSLLQHFFQERRENKEDEP